MPSAQSVLRSHIWKNELKEPQQKTKAIVSSLVSSSEQYSTIWDSVKNLAGVLRNILNVAQGYIFKYKK